jgi:predicted transcriptional regulator
LAAESSSDAAVDKAADAEASDISRHLVLVSSAVRIRIADGLRERGHKLTVAVTHSAGLSLQRAGQLVAQLEEDGYVQRVPDDEDGRARRVVYTRRGRRLLRDIDSLVDETNALLASIVGEGRFEQLRADLARLDRVLNERAEGIRVVTG